MIPPFNARAPTFDAEAINATIARALASAGLDTSTGPMREVTETIRRALAAGGGADGASPTSPNFDSASVIDVTARVIPSAPEPQAVPGDVLVDEAPDTAPGTTPGTANATPRPSSTGRFEAHQFGSATGSLRYKLYVPAAPSETQRPMIVMLHGCTQSADDFAAGTQMNRLADEHGFLVVYPEQVTQANPNKCWNWFSPQDQRREGGEPALIAGVVREVQRAHNADPRRIFVAGLSAGAAMAVVLGETYPDLFAGIGAHSGLPYGSAHDVGSALAAMKGGRGGAREAARRGPGGVMRPGASSAAGHKALQPVPTIVFHGDRDHTVQHSNGVHIVLQALDAHTAAAAGTGTGTGTAAGAGGLSATTRSGVAPGGRRFNRAIHTDAQGRTLVESWTVLGAGHAWSGGHAQGSYTDAGGPDASAEMVRFFLALSPSQPKPT